MTIALDADPAAVEKNYRRCKQEKNTYVLPLVNDLSNPSPSIGWQNKERKSLLQRGPANTLMALALIHHLTISCNIPFSKIAQCFHDLCTFLIIEFVPKDDAQIKRLLVSREDIFDDYSQAHFESVFSTYFSIEDRKTIPESERCLYFMKKKDRL